ncbi:hypothetical protein L7F22_045322 [Adiantum nelumboides]|nr:hypothetical protein [Adiantum nelumboides]
MAQQAAAPSLIPSAVRSYHLDKILGLNYLTWATRVTLLLKRATLWEVVDGTIPKPAPNSPNLADWTAKDLQAQAELMLHLGDRQKQMVRRCQSSQEIWNFLHSAYHHEDLITRVTALKKLLGSALNEHQDTAKFLDEWRVCLNNALLLGLQLDDSLQSMFLLAALPPSWCPFITTQAIVVGLTAETLIAHMLQEDAMRTSINQVQMPVISAQNLQRSKHCAGDHFDASLLSLHRAILNHPSKLVDTVDDRVTSTRTVAPRSVTSSVTMATHVPIIIRCKFPTSGNMALRSDNGKEYVSNALLQFCKVEGIKHQVTIPYTPQQNGVVERKNGTLVAVARAMMLTANLPKLYWEEAVATSCYLQNQTPHSIDPHNTPYHHWFGRQPNLQHLRVFGCAAYAVKAADLRHKLDPTSTRMNKFHFAHSIYFDEGSLLSPQQGDLSTVSNNDTLSSPTIPKVNPQTEWEEAELLLNPNAQVQAPVLPVQPHQSPVASPNPIPTPQRPVLAWSLGRKTNSLLFPRSPNPLFPGKTIFKRGLLLQPSLSPASSMAEPLVGDVFPHQGSSGFLKQPLPSSTTTPAEICPDSPIEPLKQPILLGRPSTPGSMSKLKTRSLKEIYDNSNLAILFDSKVQHPATPNFIAPTSSTNLKVADAFVLQVLHASMNAPFDPSALNSSAEIVDGIAVTEAFAGSEADLWQQAMDFEYQSLIENGTWELVSLLSNCKFVTCKWLLRKKLHDDGSVSRYKARLVARGFSQVPGMDYSKTFSPVLRITSFRVLITIAAQF